MTRPLLALAALLLLLPGCGEEPAPAEPETPELAEPAPAEAAEPAEGGALFASAAEDIVMKEAPSGSIFGSAEAKGDAKAKPAATKPAATTAATSTAARTGGGGAGEVDGGRTITADQVKAVVKAKTPQVRACYERELKKREGLRGKVVLAWTIRANGTVTGTHAVRNTTRNTAMIPCMTRAVSQWRFPRAESSFDVEYPFVFKPRDW